MTFEEFRDDFEHRLEVDSDMGVAATARHLFDHLLATGVDPGAVLRGEARQPVQLDPAETWEEDARRALRVASAFTLETQSCEEAVRELVRLLEVARGERDHVVAKLDAAPPALTELRALAEKWRTATYVDWNDIDDCAEDAAFETLKGCADDLTAALDAMGAKK